MQRRRTRRKCTRRGSVAIEFALAVPVFLALVLGIVEASRLYDLKNQLATAAREGARLAAMDRSDMLAEGQSTNQKIIDDIRNFLDASGLPGDAAEVTIAVPGDPQAPFDLDDPVNDLELFQLLVELPYSAVYPPGIPGMEGYTMAARVVFRNARAVMVQ